MESERKPKLVQEARPEGGRGKVDLEWKGKNMWKDWQGREEESYQK
jgi:hypothetical protein